MARIVAAAGGMACSTVAAVYAHAAGELFAALILASLALSIVAVVFLEFTVGVPA